MAAWTVATNPATVAMPTLAGLYGTQGQGPGGQRRPLLSSGRVARRFVPLRTLFLRRLYRSHHSSRWRLECGDAALVRDQLLTYELLVSIRNSVISRLAWSHANIHVMFDHCWVFLNKTYYDNRVKMSDFFARKIKTYFKHHDLNNDG